MILAEASYLKTKVVQASPLTVTMLGLQKSVTVSDELLNVSLYQNIFIVKCVSKVLGQMWALLALRGVPGLLRHIL